MILDPSGYKYHPTAIIDKGCQIGEKSTIWHFSHLMSECSIGSDCNIGQNVFIANGVILGNNVKIQNNVSLYSGVTCENDVFLGPSVVFTNILNPRSAISRKQNYLKTFVRKGATIGANATILCGISIGAYSLIGAGSVVVNSTKDYALVVGNPSRQIGWVSEFGHTLKFDNDGKAICPESGERYLLQDDQVSKISI